VDIKLLNEQHSKLVIISSRFAALLVEDNLLNNISEIEVLLSSMTDELTAHLFTEDKLLYPFLEKSDNKKIVETTQVFRSSMGGLKQSYTEYIKRWPKEKIIGSPALFIQETREILSALHDRIKKEESQLFPLVAEVTSSG